MRVRFSLSMLVSVAWLGSASAQQGFSAPTIEGFNPASPSIVAPGGGGAERPVTKPQSKAPQKKAKRLQARRSQPSPPGLYSNSVPMNPLPGNITAPMPNPRDFTVPPPVPPASPLASPPPGQSCDPYGPGHCGMKVR